MHFSDFDLHPQLQTALTKAKFSSPTPVQEHSIPPLLEGRDVMACAQTGTGKTAAFTLPLLHLLLSSQRPGGSRGPRALVLTPTRELADQVMQAIKTFAQDSKLTTGLVVGGMPYPPQVRLLNKQLDVLVATPGRLIDHLQSDRVDLSAVQMVVLDEADRMLDMGFAKPVAQIMSETAKVRQTLLFSATFNAEVEKLAKTFLTDPAEVRLASKTQNHDQIEQSLYFTADKAEKIERLKTLLDDTNMWQAVVFMRTKHATEKLAREITNWGHPAAALHGDMRQNARKRVVQQLHNNKLKVLVATDVAARGLDVKDLSHVINFDLPMMAEDYIHRIGRTGRAGATGVAFSLVSRDEMGLLRDIEKMIGQKIIAHNEAPSSGKSNPERHKATFKFKPRANSRARQTARKGFEERTERKNTRAPKKDDAQAAGERRPRPAGKSAEQQTSTLKPKTFNKRAVGERSDARNNERAAGQRGSRYAGTRTGGRAGDEASSKRAGQPQKRRSASSGSAKPDARRGDKPFGRKPGSKLGAKTGSKPSGRKPGGKPSSKPGSFKRGGKPAPKR